MFILFKKEIIKLYNLRFRLVIKLVIDDEFSKAEVEAETVCSNLLSLVLNSVNPFVFNIAAVAASKSIFKLESSTNLSLNLVFNSMASVTSWNHLTPLVIFGALLFSQA